MTLTEETFANIFVVCTVPELDPVIVSVNAAPFKSVPVITKELELGMFHWAKIDGIQIKRTLSVLLNSKRYYSNATQIFKEEILGMLVTSSTGNKTLF